MSQNLPKRSLGDVLSLRHPNRFVLAGANNRNVIITYRFLAAPVQANRDFFYIDCMTVYFNCKYFPWYTRELLECLLGISPSRRNPCGGKNITQMVQVEFLDFRIKLTRGWIQIRICPETISNVSQNFEIYSNLPNSAKSGHHGNRWQRVILLVLLERNK